MSLQYFIHGAPIILLVLTILFRKRIAVFSGTLLKITLAIFIGGFGGFVWLLPLFRCVEGESATGCLILMGIRGPIIIVVGTLFMYAILENILKRPQELQSKKPSHVNSVFSVFALALAFIVGIVLFNILSNYAFLNFDNTFYAIFVAPLISIVFIGLMYIGLKKIFSKISRK